MNAESDERNAAPAPAATGRAADEAARRQKVERAERQGERVPGEDRESEQPRAERPADEKPRGGDGERENGLGSRAPDFIKASRPLHLSWQVGVFLVGLAVVAGGALLLPLPGPGWLIIFGGMAIWATEFVWAQLVLRWTKRKVTEAAHKALDPRVRRRNIILTSIGAVVVAGLLVVYFWRYGFVMPWKIGK